MNLQALREKRATIVAAMEEVLNMAEADGRVELNAEEQELYDSYAADLEQVKAAIAQREAVQSERAALAQPGPAPLRPVSASMVPGPEARQEFESVGEFIGAVVRHSQNRGSDPRLEWHDMEPSAQGQRMDDGPSGGFIVPTQFRDTLLMVDPQGAVIEARSNIIPAGIPPDAAITMPALDQTDGNTYGGVEVSWIGEGKPKPATEAKLRQVTLTPHELAAHVPLTDKLMRNAPAFSGVIEQLMRGALTSAREHAFLSGDGVAKPLGILSAPATYMVNRDTANQIRYEDLDTMVSRLLMGGSPYWLITQSAYTQLTRIRDPEGNYVWQANAVVGSPGSVFGYPVFWHGRSPLLGSRGDIALVSTNPFYMVKHGSGPFVAMGFAGNDFINNMTRIKIFHNVDAQPWLTEPFQLESGWEVSPFVALDVPAA